MVVTFIFGTLKFTCAYLDIRRLDKQKVEAKQILDAIQKTSGGWTNHPAVHMWRGYENGLKYYFNCIVEACIRRGLNNTMTLYEFTQEQLDNIEYQTVEDYLYLKNEYKENSEENSQKILMPWWFTWQPLLHSHQCSLLRKNPEYYGKLFSTDGIEDYVHRGYVWPAKLTDTQIANFIPEYCDPIGAGAPANYRWTKDQVLQWIDDPFINPKTNRRINPDSKTGIASDLKKAVKIYKLEMN